MSHSIEELKALAAAINATPETEEEISAFMADVDAGKYDDTIAKSCPSPAELAKQCVDNLKAEREKLRQELAEAAICHEPGCTATFTPPPGPPDHSPWLCREHKPLYRYDNSGFLRRIEPLRKDDAERDRLGNLLRIARAELRNIESRAEELEGEIESLESQLKQ